MHYHSDVIIHVLGDISEETSSQDTDSTECNTDIVNVLVRLSIRELTSVNHQLVGARYAFNAWKLFEEGEKRGTCDYDCLADDGLGCDVELSDHCAADEVRSSGYKFCYIAVSENCIGFDAPLLKLAHLQMKTL